MAKKTQDKQPDTKAPKEASELFHNIMKASVKGTSEPKPKPKKGKK